MADPTAKEVNFIRSMKRFIRTELEGLGIFVAFDMLYSAPKDYSSGDEETRWVCVSFDERDKDTVISQFIAFDLFTINDSEKDNMYELSDIIEELFTDEDHNLGIQVVPLFNTVPDTWEQIGGVLPFHRKTTRIWPSDNKTMVRTITFECKWGAKV